MKKLLFFIILIGLTNCKLNEVNKTHGSLNLDKKHKKLELSVSNKNDIVILLGPPSTVSQFDNNTWYYIERKVTNTSIFTLGREKVLKNNVLVLELDKNGILKTKEFLQFDDMKDIKFSKNTTDSNIVNKNFLYNFFNSVRQKINEPIKKSVQKK
tara:strand:+ start:1510 stop:1974 length:465 start_codon:yes stop_codon:yes gene_type:complete